MLTGPPDRPAQRLLLAKTSSIDASDSEWTTDIESFGRPFPKIPAKSASRREKPEVNQQVTQKATEQKTMESPPWRPNTTYSFGGNTVGNPTTAIPRKRSWYRHSAFRPPHGIGDQFPSVERAMRYRGEQQDEVDAVIQKAHHRSCRTPVLEFCADQKLLVSVKSLAPTPTEPASGTAESPRAQINLPQFRPWHHTMLTIMLPAWLSSSDPGGQLYLEQLDPAMSAMVGVAVKLGAVHGHAIFKRKSLTM
ncbi:hypothetical protein FRB99_003987 [Tulasnella sp. 403]|nr:hypothetical protein FRB99_003987 [Tulasnella sp. 403]